MAPVDRQVIDGTPLGLWLPLAARKGICWSARQASYARKLDFGLTRRRSVSKLDKLLT